MADGEMTPQAIQVVLTRVALRQEEMEARFARIEAALGLAAPPPPSVLPEPAPLLLTPLPAPLPAPPPPPPPNATLEARVGLQWLNRIGVVTLILGIAFAFKTATDNDWIGPSARVSLGALAALIALVAGDRLWARGHAVFAQGLVGLGLATLYLVLWASFSLYELTPQPVAFALMVATTIGSALLALRHGAQAIAVLALIGGFITPVVLASGEPHAVIFLGYLALLQAGALVLARRRAWSGLEALAATGTLVLYAAWLATAPLPEDAWIATAFAAVLYAELAAARGRGPWVAAQLGFSLAMAVAWREPVAALAGLLAAAAAGLLVRALRSRHAAPAWTLASFWLAYGFVLTRSLGPDDLAPSPLPVFAELTLAFALFTGWVVVTHRQRRRARDPGALAVLVIGPAAYFAAAYALLAPTAAAYLGLLAVALAAAHVAVAYLVWTPAPPNAADARPGWLALGVAATSFALAVPIQVAGFAIPIAWSLQGAALVWLGVRADHRLLRQGGALLLGLAATAIALDDRTLGAALPPLLNPRALAFAVLVASAFASARWLRGRPAVVAALAAHALVLIGVGLELVGWIARTAPAGGAELTSVALSIWMAADAVFLVALGVVRGRRVERVAGLGLLALVIVKLYARDVWILGHAFRIAAFLGLGVMLLLVSYLYSRYRARIERLWTADERDATRT